uniref:Uncharacterized protein n=1 Tax=Myoviridae sp. ctCo31 TaxID=2825053 RepID=A0A8S5UM65_9CAUD|nr:MAG TPA: hypothetical protein [Myoviridae sp. ctCo31]
MKNIFIYTFYFRILSFCNNNSFPRNLWDYFNLFYNLLLFSTIN